MSKSKLPLLIIIITFVVHSSYIFNGFVWLDHGDIENGRAIASSVTDIFLKPFADTSFYRPLVTLSLSLDKIIFNNAAWGYHLTNVILQMLTTLTVFFFAKRSLKIPDRFSFLSAHIFGVHPLSIQPVGVISYRPELMFTFGLLLSLYVLTTIKKKKYFLLFVSSLLALFSKETAIFILPISIVLSLHYLKPKVSYKKVLGVVGSAMIIYIILRVIAVGKLWVMEEQGGQFYQVLLIKAWLLVRHLLSIISPFPLGISDAIDVSQISPLLFAVALFIVLFAYKLIRSNSKKERTLLIALIFFSVLPALSIVPIPRLQSLHYAYSTLVFAALLISFVLYKLRSERIRDFFVGTLAIWMVIAGYNTFTSGYKFYNDLVLFTEETQKDNNFREGWFYLGYHHTKEKRYELAEQAYEKALSKDRGVIAFVDEEAAKVNLSAVKLALGKNEEAKQLIESTETMKKDQEAVFAYNQAVAAWEKGDPLNVIVLLSPFVDHWKIQEPNFLLARAYIEIGQKDNAIDVLDRTLNVLDEDKKAEVINLIEELKNN